MKINCPICYLSFDESTHSPRIIRTCGHTICLECIKKIIIPSTQCFSLKCPFCSSLCEISKTSYPTVESAFFYNFALRQQVEDVEARISRIPKCIFHGKPISSVCLTEACQESRKCCLECVRKKHTDCNDEDFVAIDQIGTKIMISNYTQENSFYENALDVVIKEYLESFNSLLTTMFQSYKANLSDFRMAEKCLDPANPEFDLYLLKLLTNTQELITVSHYNFYEFDGLDKDAVKLREILEPIKNDLATKCIDFITDSFKNLNQARLDKNTSIEVKEIAYRPAIITADPAENTQEETNEEVKEETIEDQAEIIELE